LNDGRFPNEEEGMRKMTTLVAFLAVVGFSGAVMAEAPAGEKLYMKKCKVCHGKDGTATKAGLKKESPENLFASIKDWTEEQVVENVTKGKNKMPTFGPREGKKSKLTPEEILAVSKYVMSMKK